MECSRVVEECQCLVQKFPEQETMVKRDDACG